MTAYIGSPIVALAAGSMLTQRRASPSVRAGYDASSRGRRTVDGAEIVPAADAHPGRLRMSAASSRAEPSPVDGQEVRRSLPKSERCAGRSEHMRSRTSATAVTSATLLTFADTSHGRLGGRSNAAPRVLGGRLARSGGSTGIPEVVLALRDRSLPSPLVRSTASSAHPSSAIQDQGAQRWPPEP